jgi:aminobenzoyl-glutamate utilization protein B
VRPLTAIVCLPLLLGMHAAVAQTAADAPPKSLSGLKAEAAASVDGMQKLTQEIVDSLFSFSELGFQEFETQRYLTTILEKNGFRIDRGVSGMPSSWWATWGRGGPVIAL